MKIIPEVTNLSSGYYNEHTSNEKINANWLIKEFIPALLKVKWEELPVKRNPAIDESCYKTNYQYGNHHGNCGIHDFDNDNYYYTKSGSSKSGFNSSSGSGQKYNSGGNRCEFCDTWKYPFHDIYITGIKFVLCEDCTSKFYNSWDDGVEDEELVEFGWEGKFPTLGEEAEEDELKDLLAAQEVSEK
jgi:hypothetical protein